MNLKRVQAVLLAAVVLPVVTTAQDVPPTALPQTVPNFRVIVLSHFDAETLADFNQRVRNYAELRRSAERGISPLRITEHPDEIISSERTLMSRIREVRGSPDRGQIFSRQMERELQELFVIVVDSATLSAVMDDGPDEFDVDVNEAYARDKPLATMPPNILLLLPALAEDMEYRFVGRHLIVRDVRANMIVDEIPCALSCEQCVLSSEERDDGQAEQGGREEGSQ